MPSEDLTALVSERADDRPGDVRSVEVQVPHRMLRSGLCLLDTPGVGGLESVHGQLTLASLNGADGVLFVTDASQELTAPELDFLQTAVERCPRAALVVTKTDLYQHWREIVDPNRGHLADAGLDDPGPPGVVVPAAPGSPATRRSTRRAASRRWSSSWQDVRAARR